MSENSAETQAPEAPATPPPPARQEQPREDATAAALRSLATERDAALAEVKAREKRIAELTGERDTFRGRVEEFERRGRETALVERLARDLPSADKMALRGVVLALSDDGKLDRQPAPEALEETARKALDLIKAEASSLTRPSPVGGSSGVPVRTQQQQQRKSLVWGQ